MILSTYSVVFFFFFFFFVKNVVSLKEGDKNGPQNVVFPKKKSEECLGCVNLGYQMKQRQENPCLLVRILAR